MQRLPLCNNLSLSSSAAARSIGPPARSGRSPPHARFKHFVTVTSVAGLHFLHPSMRVIKLRLLMPAEPSTAGLSVITYRVGAANHRQVVSCTHWHSLYPHNAPIQITLIYAVGRLTASFLSLWRTSAFLAGRAISLTSCLLPHARHFIGYSWDREAQARRCTWTRCSRTLGSPKCAAPHITITA